MGHSQKTKSHLKRGVTLVNLGHKSKNVTLRKMRRIWKWVTRRKLGHTWKNKSYFNNWVTLKKCLSHLVKWVTFLKIGHSCKDGSHLEEWVTLGRMGYTRSPLPGASICPVPLNRPFPVTNYKYNRLSRENILLHDSEKFLRTLSAIVVEGSSEHKKVHVMGSWLHLKK